MKFPLKMSDGAMVRTVEDLREHFDLATVLSYYENGRLIKWLENGYYDEEAEKVAALAPASGSLVEGLCDILGVDYSAHKTAQVDLDDIAKRNQHLEQLKQITADDAILAAVDRVAFSQDDLSELLNKGITEIYLYGKKFVIPEEFENNTYICLGDSEIEFNCEIMRLKKAAESGDLNAQMKLGNGYFEGTFKKFTQDPIAEAAKWYQMAAEQGCAEGQVKLGRCYLSGKGAKQSYQLAFEWFSKSAEQGDREAQYELGLCYQNGHGVRVVKKWAAELFAEAAEQGHAGAQYQLGMCYYYGNGVRESYRKAAEWLKKAAEQGHKEAQRYSNLW